MLRSTTKIATLALGITIILPCSALPFCFEEAGAKYGIPPQLIWSISKLESGHNPFLINYNTDGSYDYGMMQINTVNAEELRKAGIPWETLSDPCTNVMAGTWLLAKRIHEYGYNWKGIGAYHSKTPAKRDRYARLVAKILSTIKERPVERQPPEPSIKQAMLENDTPRPPRAF